MSDIAIQVENLGKRYEIGQAKSGDLRESFGNWLNKFRKAQSFDSISTEKQFWALRDISFQIKKGEAVGIIGRNGAGKSTLLKILSRITDPTTGRFIINGRVSSLLEVGTGFHPELSGRENIFLNGTILGMKRREIKSKFDEIVEFSGVAKFIDTPVKHYSSGMKVRLAFSVAAHLEPEILIVDEVLAVGDAEFQKKCLGKMDEVSKSEGRTIMFVSHNMAAVQNLCNKTIMLSNGEVTFNGSVSEGVSNYLSQGISEQRKYKSLIEILDRKGSGNIRFTKVAICDVANKELEYITSGMDTYFHIFYEAKEVQHEVIFRLQVIDNAGIVVFTCNNFHSAKPIESVNGNGCIVCEIPNIPLFSGNYTISLQCLVGFDVADELENAVSLNVEDGDFFGTGKLPAVKSGVLVNHNWIEVKC
jgi:lipopolysaccharide transport system ATP-binding protein